MPTTGTLHVVKLVTNDGGGTATPSGFEISVTQEGQSVDGSPQAGSNTGTDYTLPGGSYTVSEVASTSYTGTFSGACDDNGNVTVTNGQTATCTITNTYVPPSTGSIEITKYACPDGTVVTRSANGVGGTVPSGCTPDVGKTFGYVHGSQTDANGPFPELTTPLTAGGATDSNGVLTVHDLQATGRYLIEETNASSQRLADGDILGLYCEGDGDTSGNNDNQELTFVPAGGTTHCVAYDKAPAPTCNEEATETIVSDANTQVDQHDAVLVTPPHPSWATILGASWIWNLIENGATDSAPVGTKTFTRDFSIVGVPTSAALQLSSDNGYAVTVNGHDLSSVSGCSSTADQTWSSEHTCVVPPEDLLSGANTLSIDVTNFPLPEGSSGVNPAGLVYSLTVNANECQTPPPPQPTTIHVVATKIVCDNESDLPNWGAGGPAITSSTASSFLEAHQSCHRADGWSFEWGNQSVGDAGDSLIGHASGYTTFGPTDANGVATTTISLNGVSDLHMREVLQNGFIPFTYDSASTTPNGNDVSAEFYCANDVLNYDNYDFIRSPQADATYYCVAFNAPVAPQVSTVTMCKADASGAPLPGWGLSLAGAHVEDLNVPTNVSSGIDTTNSLDAGTSYLATAIGTWLNQGGANPADAEYSTTDNWATHMDGYTGYSTDILELQINSTFDPNSNWGPYNSAHTYAQSFVPAANGPANFRIFDGTGTTQNESWFGDNSGTLSVSLDKGYAGITGENGCVTFDTVPYGSYTVSETPQDGWTNVSGTGPVTVNAPTETYTVVNMQGSGNGESSSADLSIVKTVDTQAPDAGAQVTYTLTLDNAGPDAATGVVVTDVLPSGVTYVSDDSNGAYATSTGQWTVGNLANGSSATLHITATVDGGTEGQTIDNSASVTSGSSDPDPENDSGSASFTVNAPQGGPTDVCPNIAGVQTSVPNGMHLNDDKQCVNNGAISPVFTGGSIGQVLGASCGPYLSQYLRKGNPQNDPDQVTKLQQFLSNHGFGSFAPTGYFGPATEAAVKAFQKQHSDEILKPWGIMTPTGLVYLTTLRQINLVECSDLDLPLPPLVPWS